jgi:hypothetical protein
MLQNSIFEFYLEIKLFPRIIKQGSITSNKSMLFFIYLTREKLKNRHVRVSSAIWNKLEIDRYFL